MITIAALPVTACRWFVIVFDVRFMIVFDAAPPVTAHNDVGGAHPIVIPYQPEPSIDCVCKIWPRQEAFDARKEVPVVEHEVLMAVELLVKVDALDTLRHILPRHSPRPAKLNRDVAG